MLGYAGKTRRGRGRGGSSSAHRRSAGARIRAEGAMARCRSVAVRWAATILWRGRIVNAARARGGVGDACAHAAEVASKLAKQASLDGPDSHHAAHPFAHPTRGLGSEGASALDTCVVSTLAGCGCAQLAVGHASRIRPARQAKLFQGSLQLFRRLEHPGWRGSSPVAPPAIAIYDITLLPPAHLLLTLDTL
jgi:hypothetical protein